LRGRPETNEFARPVNRLDKAAIASMNVSQPPR